MRPIVNPIQVQRYLRGIDYPARKGQLAEKARGEGADESTLSTLYRLPDQDYNSPNDVSEALGNL